MTPDEKIKMTLGDLMVRLAIIETERDQLVAKVTALEAGIEALKAKPEDPKPLLGDDLHA